MKLREGFVSNSSSSSFIVKDSRRFPEIKKFLKACHEDCYVYRGILYTTFVSDMKDEIIDLKKLEYVYPKHEGNHGTPYCEEDYVKVNGLLGEKEVFIPKEDIHKEDYKELTGIDVKEAFDFYLFAKSMIEQNIETPESMINEFKRILKIGDINED